MDVCLAVDGLALFLTEYKHFSQSQVLWKDLRTFLSQERVSHPISLTKQSADLGWMVAMLLQTQKFQTTLSSSVVVQKQFLNKLTLQKCSQCLSAFRSESRKTNLGLKTYTDIVSINSHIQLMQFPMRQMLERKLKFMFTLRKAIPSCNVSYVLILYLLLAVPTGRLGMSDYHGTGGVSCSFGKFGSSMGMYLN